MPEQKKPLSKTEYVYEWLKEEILSGRLNPGERIRQHDVAKALDVSYTPVREAIRQLQATGLIIYEPNKGNAVGSLNDAELRELYHLRGVVEGLGARLAVEKITDAELDALQQIHEAMLEELATQADPAKLARSSREFHSLIITAGGPLIIRDKVAQIWSHYPVTQDNSLWVSRTEAKRALAAHTEILAALRARDPELVEQLMELHIAEGMNYRLEQRRSKPEEA